MASINYWYYFDIETTSFDENLGTIITIQYQPLYYDVEGRRLKPEEISEKWDKSELTILKEWDSDEKTILKQMYEKFLETPEKREDFEPIGNNLSFEGKFLKKRMLHHGIIDEKNPLKFGHLDGFDVRPVAILINSGFRNYAKFFGKAGVAKNVPPWHENKEYDKIIEYVQDETKSFIKTFDFLMKELPKLRDGLLDLHKN